MFYTVYYRILIIKIERKKAEEGRKKEKKRKKKGKNIYFQKINFHLDNFKEKTYPFK